MTEDIEKPAVDIHRKPPNFPLVFIGGFVLLCLIGSIVLAFDASAWSILLTALFALAGVTAYAYFTSIKRPLGLEHRLDWKPALTDVQKQSLALEVEGIAASLELDPWQTTELFTAYVVAEDLALRQIQQEYGSPMIRHLQVGGAPFDALIIEKNELICIDVSFLVKPDIRQEKIDSMLKKAVTVRHFLDAEKLEVEMRLLVVIVTQLTPEEVTELRSRLTRRFPDSPVNIDITLFDFEELQRSYITEN